MSGSVNYVEAILVIGLTIGVVMLIKAAANRVGIPALVGYIALGCGLCIADRKLGMSEETGRILEFMAKIGVITLLFRIGLESEVRALVRQLRRASLIWIGGVVISAGSTYFVCRWLADLGLIPSLFAAVAMTATSVGVPVTIWHHKEALESSRGQLLIDVAELDDISGVTLMALLFAVAPVLHQAAGASVGSALGQAVLLLLGKLLVFGALCILFSIFLEERITCFFERVVPSPDPMLVVAGIGFVIAAIAELLGFSFAIGAFFAGLAFSRDPDAVKFDASFKTLFELFSPFFFIGIGLTVSFEAVGSALLLGGLLILVAYVGKLLGHGLPALAHLGFGAAATLAVSMTPRAEIAMVVMGHGRALGDWAVPSQLYAASVMVVLATCIVAPVVVQRMLQKYPPENGGS
jgi:Kef-type K+ transport system membrane component KefB